MPTQQPTWEYEEQYWGAGIGLIAGVDEVGMGALAGPVCAAAVIFPPDKGGQGGLQLPYLPYDLSLPAKARDNRKNPTEPEKRIWHKALRNKLLGYKFLRQKPIKNFIIDFYCAELMLAIEIDGDTHDEGNTYDANRTKELESLGVFVVRYSNTEVMKNTEGIVTDLKSKIQDRLATLHPLPTPSVPLIRGKINVDQGGELIRDSKMLSPKQREKSEVWIKANALAWAIGEATVEEINHINIRQASHLAMRRALTALGSIPDLVLVDGNPVQLHEQIPTTNVIKGDQLCYSIAAASILAKVHRDALMVELDAQFPVYGFASHKGYGSPTHLAALKTDGATIHHRRAYAPVAAAIHNGI